VEQSENCDPSDSGLREVLQNTYHKTNPLQKAKIILEITIFLTQNIIQLQKVVKKLSNLQLQ